MHISAVAFFRTNAVQIKLAELSSEFDFGRVVKVLAIVAFRAFSFDEIPASVLKVVFSRAVVVDLVVSSLFH